MKPKIAMLVPSRGRPDNIVALRDAFSETCDNASKLFVFVDSNDPTLPAYRRIEGIALGVGTPNRLGPWLNFAGPLYSQWFEAVGFMGDDHRPRTHGWDRELLEELRRLGTGLAYGNDLIQGPNLPTAVVMTSSIPQKLGYMVPPGMQHLFLDNFWLSLGRNVGLTYRDDVIIEHCHPIGGTAEWDEGYVRANDGGLYATDERVFLDYMDTFFSRDVEVLRG